MWEARRYAEPRRSTRASAGRSDRCRVLERPVVSEQGPARARPCGSTEARCPPSDRGPNRRAINRDGVAGAQGIRRKPDCSCCSGPRGSRGSSARAASRLGPWGCRLQTSSSPIGKRSWRSPVATTRNSLACPYPRKTDLSARSWTVPGPRAHLGEAWRGPRWWTNMDHESHGKGARYFGDGGVREGRQWVADQLLREKQNIRVFGRSGGVARTVRTDKAPTSFSDLARAGPSTWESFGCL